MTLELNLTRSSKNGNFHDLEEYLEELQETYFDGKDLGLVIKWGKLPKKGFANISVGLYYHAESLIVISPVLCDKKVPKYFVKQVIFHEICHHLFPAELHTKQFKAAEMLYKHHTRAANWEVNHLHKILKRYL